MTREGPSQLRNLHTETPKKFLGNTALELTSLSKEFFFTLSYSLSPLPFLFLEFFLSTSSQRNFFYFLFFLSRSHPSSNNTIRKYDGPNRIASRNESTPQGNDHKHRKDPQFTIISWYEYRLRISFSSRYFFSIIFFLSSNIFFFLSVLKGGHKPSTAITSCSRFFFCFF